MDSRTQLNDATKLIDGWLEYQVYAGRLPGLAVGVVYKNEIIFSKGYGYADSAKQVRTTPTTCYRIASFSKVFTAIATLQLLEQEKLLLDESVQRYLPWFSSEQAPETAQITVRQLLTHTSGLDRDGDTPHWCDFQFPTPERIQRHLHEGAMTFTPATEFKYSNFGYTILGEIITSISGVSYEEYVTENIVRRLGLTGTAPMLTDALSQHLALGYSRDIPGQQREPFPRIDTRAMDSATGFASNVTDLCQFIMAQFNGNTTLLKDETKREMRRIQWLREESDSDWALGLETWRINKRRFYGHGGSFQGYKSRFAFDPEGEFGIVILANAIDAPSADLANGALQIIDQLLTSYDKFADNAASGINLEEYTGIYRSIWSDLAVSAINQRLVLYSADAMKPADEFDLLSYKGADEFVISSGDSMGSVGERARFERDETGVVYRLFTGAEPQTRFEYPPLA